MSQNLEIIETGEKTPTFLVNTDKFDFNSIPVDKEERLYRIGDNEALYRMIWLSWQLDSKDDGVWYKLVPGSITTNFPEDRIRTILDPEKQNVAKSRILS